MSTPPAPAKAIAPRSVAAPSFPANHGKLATVAGVSVTTPSQDDAWVATVIPTTRKTRITLTRTVSIFSTDWYTTGERASTRPTVRSSARAM